MKISIRFISLLILLTISTKQAFSQENKSSNSLVQALTSHGFENVGVHQDKNNLYLFYENRLYRWEIDGLRKVIEEASKIYNDSITLHVIPMHHQIPVSVISYKIGNFQKRQIDSTRNALSGDNLRVTFSIDSVKSLQKNLRLQNSPKGRVDLILLPGLRFQIGNFDNPFEKRISISPILQTSLWKGNLLSAELLIPLFNDLQQTYEGDIRLETATINQLVRLPHNLFFYSSAGIFPYTNRLNSVANYKRYGLNAEMRKYLFNGRFAMGANIGWTGFMNFKDGYFNYWAMDKINYAIYAEYHEPKYDINTRLTAGKFLYEDNAVRLDISRQFHEFSFGVFIIKSDLKTSSEEIGTVGGLCFTIPISPKRSFRPSAFRVNLAKSFSYEFRERTVDPLAITFRTNNDWNDVMRNLNPDFTVKNLPSQ